MICFMHFGFEKSTDDSHAAKLQKHLHAVVYISGLRQSFGTRLHISEDSEMKTQLGQTVLILVDAISIAFLAHLRRRLTR